MMKSFEIRNLYRLHFQQPRRERLFLASSAFFITFSIVRLVTHAIRANLGPFGNISFGGLHIHHLVFGILLLLVVGYLWLIQVGGGDNGDGASDVTRSRWPSRLTSILYGIAAALTLDEFALWLDLRDVYWDREGRLSVDAVFLFGAFLTASLLGSPFVRAVLRLLKRRVTARLHKRWGK